jgi:hypothetical protein
MVSLVDHAHDVRTPVATAWVLCAGAVVVLCTTMLVSGSLQARQRDPAFYRLLTRPLGICRCAPPGKRLHRCLGGATTWVDAL